MLKNKILPTVVLASICIIVALVLSVANIFTAPIIKDNQYKATQNALREVYPEGKVFDEKNTADYSFPEEITEIYAADDGGYVFKCSMRGYKKGLVIMVGVSPDGSIKGTKYIESQETNGAEKKLDGVYDGKKLDSLSVEVIGGSTKTSKAYHDAVKISLEAFSSLKGVSPEELLAQKEAEAIVSVYPSAELVEYDASATVIPPEVTKVYRAADGGFVFKCEVTGYKPGLTVVIGVDKDGKISGSQTIASNETNGAEKKLDGAYNGKVAEGLTVETVAKSTKTSEAYHSAIKASLDAFDLLKGGQTE